MKVLVTDAHSIASLECVRSLGRRGVRVVAAGEEGSFPVAAYSRYCARYRTYASPSDSVEVFVRAFLEMIEEEQPDVTLLTTDKTILPFCRNREAFSALTSVVLPDDRALLTAFDKVATLELAMSLRVPVPRTSFIESRNDISRAVATMTPPFVVKPRASYVIEGGRLSKRRGVIFICGGRDFDDFYSRNGSLSTYPILQEWRPGFGVGVSGIFDHGRPLVLFSHRRIREEYPLGGRSSYCESIEPDEGLTKYAKSLLSELAWHGPAMVEFRISENGSAHLMEINGRLWGSLPLAVAAGIDVPWILYLMAVGKEVAPPLEYEVGLRGRYLVADINYLVYVLRGRPAGWPGPYPKRLQAVASFFGAFFRGATYFTWRRDDPMPGLRELIRFFMGLLARIIHKRKIETTDYTD